MGTLVGKTRYVSPEQLRGEPVTEQSDIYWFGMLAYEVLAGRGPYEVSGEAQTLIAHLQGKPLLLESAARSRPWGRRHDRALPVRWLMWLGLASSVAALALLGWPAAARELAGHTAARLTGRRVTTCRPP